MDQLLVENDKNTISYDLYIANTFSPIEFLDPIKGSVKLHFEDLEKLYPSNSKIILLTKELLLQKEWEKYPQHFYCVIEDSQFGLTEDCVFKINFSNIVETLDLFRFFNEINLNRIVDVQVGEIHNRSCHLIKSATKIFKDLNLDNTINKTIILSYLKGLNELFLIEDLNQLEIFINEVFLKEVGSYNINVFLLTDLTKIILYDTEIEFFSINSNDEMYILSINNKNEIVSLNGKNSYELFILLLMDLIEKFDQLKKVNINNESDGNIWKNAFYQLPIPCALISLENELIFHNSAFSKLELFPKLIENIADGQEFEIGTRVYKITKKIFEFGNLVVFNEHNDFDSGKATRNLTSQDLGIITSSIAHEINNPLAGVLAAINYLELEDFWSDDSRNALGEMNKSAKRSKDLVEIFLGFSKVNDFVGQFGSLNMAFRNSLELLRFRMIETNIKIDIELKPVKDFEKTINLSIMSMVYYLILSEVMTSFNHMKLIHPNCGNKIEGLFIENNNSVDLKLPKNLNISNVLKKSKLVTYLLDSQDLCMEISPGKITFEGWKLTS